MTGRTELHRTIRARELMATAGPHVWAVEHVERERGHSQDAAAIAAALTGVCDESAPGPGPNASRRPAAIHVPDVDAASAQALLRQPPLPRGATGDRDVLGIADAPSLERADEVMLRGERLTEAQLAAGGWHRSALGGGWARRVCYPVDEAESGVGTVRRDGDD